MTPITRPIAKCRATPGIIDIMLIVAVAAILLSSARSLVELNTSNYKNPRFAQVLRRPLRNSTEILQYSKIPVRVDGAWLFRVRVLEDVMFKVTSESSNDTKEISLPLGLESTFFTIAFENYGGTVRIGNGTRECELLLTEPVDGISFKQLDRGSSQLPVIVATAGQSPGPCLTISISKN